MEKTYRKFTVQMIEDGKVIHEGKIEADTYEMACVIAADLLSDQNFVLLADPVEEKL